MITTALQPAVIGTVDDWLLLAGADKVQAAQAPDDDDDSYVAGNAGAQEYFFDDAAIPSDAVIVNVRLSLRYRRHAAGDGSVNARIRLGASVVQSTSTEATTATWQTKVFGTSGPWGLTGGAGEPPITSLARPGGGAWMRADLANVQGGIVHGTGQNRLTTMQLMVDWEYPPAPILALADALMADLNTGTFSKAFTATRKNLPAYELKELDSVQVTVMPVEVQKSVLSRDSTADEVTVNIIVLSLAKTTADLDALITFTDQLAMFVRFKPLAGFTWTGVAISPVFDPEHLDQRQQFTSVISVTYRKQRK